MTEPTDRQGRFMRSLTAFGVGFGLAAAVSSMHDPIGMAMAVIMLLAAGLHEWACRRHDAEVALREAEKALRASIAAAEERAAARDALDQADFSAFIEMREMDRAMDDLTSRVDAVIEGYAAAYPDAITMVPLLTQVGNVILASTGDEIRMKVTLDLDSQAADG